MNESMIYNPENELKKTKKPIKTDRMGVVITEGDDNERRDGLQNSIVGHNEQE